MFTPSRYATVLLAASIAATGVVSESTSVTPTVATYSMASLGRATHGGFGASLKKAKGMSSTNRSLRTRGDFNSSIVDSWLVVLQVGTPGQQLELSLDLGSDGFVVESTLVEQDMQTTDYPIYDPDNSTTARQSEGYTWETAYGGFTLQGEIFTDIVTLGENSWSNMTMEVVTAEPVGSPIT